ncbi:MAG TPA: M28 family peptidase, partial [Pseudomonadales bacterium]|nr:M28 family peptidase [Pseudomonadales bacterium]
AMTLAAAPVLAADLPSASATTVQAHAAFLASDELEGRDTATAGYFIAARYAATQFEQWGLRPAGDEESYFQSVPLRRTSLEEIEVSVQRAGAAAALEWKADFIGGGNPVETAIDASGEVVFAGYGIDAPAFDITDYDGIDVTGKVVMLLSGAPAGLPHAERAHFSSRRVKAEVAAAHGAIGLIQIRTRVDAERTPWERMTLNAGRPGMDWLESDGSVKGALPTLRFRLSLSDAGAEKLLEGTGTSLAQLRDEAEARTYRTRPLATSLHVKLRSSHEATASPNVVALLPGTDPVLSREHVVVTAHLDHVGVGAEVNGDSLYNGYYDNALGSAVVLEVARVLSQA